MDFFSDYFLTAIMGSGPLWESAIFLMIYAATLYILYKAIIAKRRRGYMNKYPE